MSASSFVKSKFGKEAYRQRSYQYSKFRHGASNREETSDSLSGLLTGSDPEEYRIWHDVFLNGELNKDFRISMTGQEHQQFLVQPRTVMPAEPRSLRKRELRMFVRCKKRKRTGMTLVQKRFS